MKKCPYCAEEIQDDAVVCRYCGRRLVRRRFWSSPRRKRAFLVVMAIACVVVLGVGAILLVTGKKSAPPSYLYSDSEKAYYIDWNNNGVGTAWTTYVNPNDNFHVESGNTDVTVTAQGQAVSIQSPRDSAPTLGQLSSGRLELTIGDNTEFGWTGDFAFATGSLRDYENAVTTVQQTGAGIANAAAAYASQDVADANAAASTSTDGDCILYLSGTDVSVTMHGSGSSGCNDLVLKYGSLGTGGTWSSQQAGANYPGQASLVCEYADEHASMYVVVADAGFQEYGGNLCSDLANAGGWFALRSSS